MECHHAHLSKDGCVQCGDVRKAQQDFGIGANDVKVHQIQHSRGTVAAFHAHHGIHAVVREHPV